MSERIPALALLLALPISGQEVLRKPSPFPEKNRERDAGAPASARPSYSHTGRAAGMHGRTVPVAGDTSAAPAVPGAGKACFFLAKAGSTASSGNAVGPGELVAAHATYALGSRVSVTNLANGRRVEVRIVDRFFDSRRVISVSEAAAMQLGFREAGTADVRLEPVTQ